MALTPQHTYQLLTKRPERMRAYVEVFGEQSIQDRLCSVADEWIDAGVPMAAWDYDDPHPCGRKFPLQNVWMGTSVEDQEAADKRIPELLATPAAVRFLSCEPLLGPVEIPFSRRCDCGELFENCSCARPQHDLSWVIVGGESGGGARPMDIAWARSLVSQCAAAGVACFVKQLGAKPFTSNEGLPWAADHPVTWYKLGPKGADFDNWPADLRVRSFPDVQR
jgi:protein gp37